MAPRQPTDWLLSATGGVTIQGAVGDPAVTNAVVPVGSYALAEAGGPGGYTASAWSCTGATSTDPTTGTVTLAAGDAATCTITNTDQPATLTLAKVVDGSASGSGKVPADWTLTATPVAITGQGPVTGNGDPTSPGGVNAVPVFSGAYDLSETGPAGFTSGTWLCEGGVVTGARVEIAPGGVVRCTITNTAVSPTLTLVKVVDSGTTGATTPATAWTLSATGPTPVSGATGSPRVTAAPVQVGTYDLAESGPAGFTASDWVCTGRRRGDDHLGHVGRGRERDLHDHQHGGRPEADPGQGGRHDGRRWHGDAVGLDAHRDRTDEPLGHLRSTPP